jgi:hypothetical protein
MDRKLDRIAGAVGVKTGGNEGDDEEDRRRLKEKLKAAIEQNRNDHNVVSSLGIWLEYMFGICDADQRLGKRGSRCSVPYVVVGAQDEFADGGMLCPDLSTPTRALRQVSQILVLHGIRSVLSFLTTIWSLLDARPTPVKNISSNRCAASFSFDWKVRHNVCWQVCFSAAALCCSTLQL